MLKKLQSLKAKKGFTLVELIVVIAIIAVLAAILVPTMMGYVTSSRVTSCDSTAASLKDTVGNSMVEMDTVGNKVPQDAKIELSGTSSSPTVKITVGSDVTNNSSGTYGKLYDAIVSKIKNDYDFTKNFTAVVHVVDRKAVASAYCADSITLPTDFTNDASKLRSGKYSWNGKTAGVTSGGDIIGTYPKCQLS